MDGVVCYGTEKSSDDCLQFLSAKTQLNPVHDCPSGSCASTAKIDNVWGLEVMILSYLFLRFR